MPRWLTGALLVLATVVVTGCGDSPQQKLDKAEVALASRQPETARTLAFDALNGAEDDHELQVKALRVLSYAQLRLVALPAAKQSIDQLLEKDPDSLEAREVAELWTRMRLEAILRQTDFKDAQSQERYEAARSFGFRIADWFETNHKDKARAEFLRGQIAELDAERVRRKLGDHLKTLEHARTGLGSVLQEDPTQSEDRQAKDFRDDMARIKRLAEQHYQTAIRIDPSHFEARKQFITLLADREAWGEVWLAAEAASELKDIPATLAERVVLLVLGVPNDQKKLAADRLALSNKLQGAVDDKGKDATEWKLTAARLHLFADELDKARPMLEEVLRRTPHDINAQYLMAQLHFKKRDYEKGREILEKVSSFGWGQFAFEVHLLKAMVYSELGEKALAMDSCQTALQIRPGDPSATQMKQRLIAEDSPVLLESDLEQAFKQAPADPRVARQYLQYAISQGDKATVQKIITEMERISNRLLDAHMLILIDGYNFLERYADAEKYAQELMRIRPLAADGYVRLAEVLLRQDREKEALDLVEAILTKFPELGERDMLVGRLLLAVGKFERSLELLTKSAEANPEDPMPRLMLARALASMARTQQALENLDRVLQAAPAHPQANALAARIYLFMGQHELADKHLDNVSESDINQAETPALAVQLQIKKGNLEKARQIANLAISSGHRDPMLRMMLANIALKKKEPNEAETNLKALIELQPDNSQAYQLLAKFYVQEDRSTQGLNYFRDIQRRNEPLSRLAQAMLLTGMRQFDEAVNTLRVIYEPLVAKRDNLSLSVADAIAKVYLAKAGELDGAGNTAAAERARQQAFDIFQPLIDAGHNASEAELRRIDLARDTDSAEAQLKKLRDLSMKLLPEDESLRRQVMLRVVQLGKREEALALLDQWILERPRALTARRWKGEMLIEMNRPQEAVAVFEEAMRLDPQERNLRERLALAHMATFNYAAAEQVYRDMMSLGDSSKIVALSELGRMYATLGLTKQSLATFTELEKIGRSHDPRIVYATALAHEALGEPDKAMIRFAQVPPFAPHYPHAQIKLAKVERANGRPADARARIERLVTDARNMARAVPELLKLDLRDPADAEMMRWADQKMDVANLSDAGKVQWLGARVTLAADTPDWRRVLDTLEQLQQLEPDSDRVLIARMVLMWRLKRTEQARALLLGNGRLSESALGPALAAVLEADVGSRAPRGGLAGYLESLAAHNIDAARAAVNTIPPMRTIFRSDLAAVLERPDTTSPKMTQSAQTLLAALIAREVGLSQLALELTDDATALLPSLVPAYGLRAQAMLDLRKMEVRDRLLDGLRKAGPSALLLSMEMIERSDRGDHLGAAQTAQKLLEMEPENYHFQYLLSQQFQLARKHAEAIEVLREVARRGGPFKLLAVNDLAYLVAEFKPDEMENAHAMALKAFEVAPNNMPLLDTIGWIEHLSGNDERALEHLSKAVIGLKELPEVHYHLGVVYRGLSNKTGDNNYRTWARYHLEQAALGPADRREVQQARAQLAAFAPAR